MARHDGGTRPLDEPPLQTTHDCDGWKSRKKIAIIKKKIFLSGVEANCECLFCLLVYIDFEEQFWETIQTLYS